MANSLACPTPQTLESWVLGRDVSMDHEVVTLHIEECSSCQRRLATLTFCDTIVDAMRAPASALEHQEKHEISALIARAKKTMPAPSAQLDAADTVSESEGNGADDWTRLLAPAQRHDELGRLGPYRILKVLGTGGMGVVFQAEDVKLQRIVALKAMKPKVAASSAAGKRFLREARAMAALKHDNIVTIYQVDEDRGIPYLAMEFLEGMSLADRLKQGPALSIQETVTLAKQVAKGLAAAHARGMVHRDIKPDNIWLETRQGDKETGRQGDKTKKQGENPEDALSPCLPVSLSPCLDFRVKLLDFGLARAAAGEGEQQLTQDGVIVGTPAYMSPEQGRGQTVDHRGDLFSLGVVLYRMVTGQMPFRGVDTVSTLMAVSTHEPAAPSAINAEVPVELSALIMCLLAKDPGQRPASAQEVVTSLNKIDLSVPVDEAARFVPAATATHTASVPTAKRAASSTGLRRWLIAAAFMLALGGLGWFLATAILRLTTPHGTLVVEVDGDADLRFKNGKLQIYDEKGNLKYELEPSEKNKTLPAGKYQIKVSGTDGLKLDTEKFEMSRAGVTVRVTLDQAALAKKDDVSAYALEFGGKDAHVSLPIKLPPRIPFTWEAWITPRDQGDMSLCALPFDDGQGLYRVALKSGGPQAVAVLARKNAIGMTASKSLPASRPFHLAVCFDGVKWSLWVDGRKVGEGANHYGWVYEVKSVFTGRLGADIGFAIHPAQKHESFRGRIGEIRISKTTRYEKEFTPARRFEPNADTVALYHCDEGKGYELKDSSGNGRNGLLVGAKWVKLDDSPPLDSDRRAAEWVLSIGGTVRVNDQERIRALAELPKDRFVLTRVELPGNQRVTDADLANLRDCKNLTWIVLASTKTTSAGLVHLQDLSSLKTLGLAGTKVDDAGLAHLKGLTKLGGIFLRGTPVTDAGIRHLEGLTNLTSLDLGKTKVTATGIERLQKALPNCRIEWDGTTAEPTSPSKESPFVLVRDDKIVQDFKSLGGAIFASKAGDAIEVHDNGPLSLGGLEYIDKPLILRAAAGYRPWFVLAQGISVKNAPLEIEGCDFDGRLAPTLFIGTGPSWEFRRCRFWGCVLQQNGEGKKTRLADCLILGNRVFLTVRDNSAVEFDNCLTHIQQSVVRVNGENGTIRLKDSTFVLAGFGGPTVVFPVDEMKSVKVEATGNLFVSANSHNNGPIKGPKGFQWHGRENLFAGRWAHEDKLGKRVKGNLARWNELWERPEEGSAEAPDLKLEWSRPNGLDWAGTRALYEPLVASAKQRHRLADLGPEWDLIGSGDAYIKALEKESGKAIPKDRLRLEAPDGKAIVILRKDTIAGGYRTLQEAITAAQDSDIIELRTDGPSKGAGANGKGRRLTIRAVPGYAPMVGPISGSGQDRLILEGLRLTGSVSGTPSEGPKGFESGGPGGIERIANCLIEKSCGSIFRGPDGKPAEVINSWIGSLHAGMRDSPLRLVNSVVRRVQLDLPAKDAFRLEVERCVLANWEPGFPESEILMALSTRMPSPKLSVSLKRSFVQAPGDFTRQNDGNSWEAAGNVYAVPHNYEYGRPALTLGQWSDRYKIDADSFEDRPPQLDPTQWRIRPDSPGYVRRKDGRDFGADVEQILRAK